jgi:glycosyltransferase involved in cell wall biosynthesis
MKFSLIVVCSDSIDRNTRCLNALAAQPFKDFEVLVANSGLACPALPDERFRLISLPENLTEAAARNYTARQAQTDWLMFIDTNVYLEPECMSVLNSATIRHENRQVFGCTLLDYTVPEILNAVGIGYFAAGFPYPSGRGWEVETLPDEGPVWGATGALLIKRETFNRTEGYDELFSGQNYEADLAFRLRLMGEKTHQVTEAFARVETVQTTHGLFDATRNTVMNFIKNMPDAFFWPLAPLHAVIQLLLLLDIPNFKQRWNGLDEALKQTRLLWEKRQVIQKSRKATLTQIACGFTWNPWKVIWRKPDIR